VKVRVRPPHGRLENVVESRERAIAGDEQTSPDLRREIVQRDPQLDDGLPT
jgi:hypothetical protein